jgi:hypothetical protein
MTTKISRKTGPALQLTGHYFVRVYRIKTRAPSVVPKLNGYFSCKQVKWMVSLK